MGKKDIIIAALVTQIEDLKHEVNGQQLEVDYYKIKNDALNTDLNRALETTKPRVLESDVFRLMNPKFVRDNKTESIKIIRALLSAGLTEGTELVEDSIRANTSLTEPKE